MNRKKNLQLAALALFCLAGGPGVASGQAADAKLVGQYTGMMNQLRAELTAKLPKLGDEQQVQQLLASDALDAKLVKFVVLQEGTPEGLAAFAQQGKEQEQLIDAHAPQPLPPERHLRETGKRFGLAINRSSNVTANFK